MCMGSGVEPDEEGWRTALERSRKRQKEERAPLERAEPSKIQSST